MEERTWRRWWDVCADVLYWLPAFYLTLRFLRSSLFLDVFDVNSCISSLAQYQHAKFPSPATFLCQPSPPSRRPPHRLPQRRPGLIPHSPAVGAGAAAAADVSRGFEDVKASPLPFPRLSGARRAPGEAPAGEEGPGGGGGEAVGGR